VEYPSLESDAQSVQARETDTEPLPVIQPSYGRSTASECNERAEVSVESLQQEIELYKEVTGALARILKDNNRKLLANLIDQSGKVIIDIESLCNIVAKQLNISIAMVRIAYAANDPGCLSKVTKIHAVDSIKINHVDYRWAYNDKYNRIQDEFSISLTRVIV
jgi:hypothetical protein